MLSALPCPVVDARKQKEDSWSGAVGVVDLDHFSAYAYGRCCCCRCRVRIGAGDSAAAVLLVAEQHYRSVQNFCNAADALLSEVAVPSHHLVDLGLDCNAVAKRPFPSWLSGPPHQDCLPGVENVVPVHVQVRFTQLSCHRE